MTWLTGILTALTIYSSQQTTSTQPSYIQSKVDAWNGIFNMTTIIFLIMHCIFTFNFALLYICRRHYGLSVPLSWADLFQTHPAVVVEALQKLYTQVTDIELYLGGELIAYICIKPQ